MNSIQFFKEDNLQIYPKIAGPLNNHGKYLICAFCIPFIHVLLEKNENVLPFLTERQIGNHNFSS